MRTFCACLIVASVAFSALAEDTEKSVIAEDKQTQITVPASWSVLKLNEAAEIQVGNEAEESYLVVLNELKADLYGWNLEKHSRVTLGRLLANVAFPTLAGPKTLTIGKSPAVQYEVRGAADDRNVVYIHTTIDGPKYFSQILAWTLLSRAETVRPKLLKAISTFREAE